MAKNLTKNKCAAERDGNPVYEGEKSAESEKRLERVKIIPERFLYTDAILYYTSGIYLTGYCTSCDAKNKNQ